MAHKLRASLRGGYEFLKPKVVEYKNSRRDINRVIGYKDAQMIVNTMNDHRAHYPNYSFEFNCQDDVLDIMFWVMLYRLMRLSEQTSVEWFFFHLLLFTIIKTRLLLDRGCLTMKALSLTISNDLFTNTDFRKRFSKLVWDINIKPDVFEVQCGLLMKEFNLEDTRWFKYMFTIRDSWIPIYFSDIPMCGLMKTTSRSESMNSFFNTFSGSENLILNFMINYDTAIQKQRNTQRELDTASMKASYKIQTPRKIKLQASKVYTSTLFFKVQKEIYEACFFCTYSYVGIEDGWEVKNVKHHNSKSEFKIEFKVLIIAEEKEINCSCEHFKRMGVLCRHAFTIMMRCCVKEIPESFESCLDIVRDDKKKLILFAEKQ
ncbi:protein FAR1-RELATED SEQUENCE 6-like [Lactuca sativa]|uniref:protein FAR1-RELATED SEQUENCE 6-like n=1 Tax=Lactuca sativa TaxID=4236 RepID=UPI000CD8B17A|nr:protein FAR1-RELATED SEQUENCE 6-like [Lactuca sativa]